MGSAGNRDSAAEIFSYALLFQILFANNICLVKGLIPIILPLLARSDHIGKP